MAKKSKLSIRSKIALKAGKIAQKASRALNFGSGEMINGVTALKISPNLIKELTHNKKVVLITGTNGKSTTTRMVAEILNTLFSVATQKNGANMDAGIAAALMENTTAQIAVLEVDELHLEHISNLTNPAIIVILNLSRDQLDRVGELSIIGNNIIKTVKKHPQATIIANADNVLATYSARDAKKIVWISGGTEWHHDSTLEPNSGDRIIFSEDGNNWWNASKTYQKPQSLWKHVGKTIYGPNNFEFDLNLKIPGDFNVGNALHAIAVGNEFGIWPEKGAKEVENISEIAGRYKSFTYDGKGIKLILVKNPAGWQSSISTIIKEIKVTNNTEIIIDVNGQVADGQDLSWLWDVSFEDLSPYKIFASGDRGTDLAIRLFYAGINYTFVENTVKHIKETESKEILVMANYTAFRDLLTFLEREKTNG